MSFSIKLFFTFVVFGIFLALFSVYSFSQAAHERQLSYKLKQANDCIIRREGKVSKYIKSLDHHLLAIVKNKSFLKYTNNQENKQKYSRFISNDFICWSWNSRDTIHE